MANNQNIKTSLQYVLKLALAFLMACALCQCASKVIVFDDPCEGVDPYELGRQDGARGLPGPEHAAADELGQCVPSFAESKAMQLYKVGRNAGLVEYCTQENGLQVGRSESSYTFVCPELMEEEFLAGYHKGIGIRKLEEKNQRLRADIAEISELLKAEPKRSELRRQSEQQLERLLNQKLAVEKKIKARKKL